MTEQAEFSSKEETMFTPTPPHAQPIIRERVTHDGWKVYVESWVPGGSPGSIMRQGKYYRTALENGPYRTTLNGRTALYRQAMVPIDGTPSTSAMVQLKIEQVKHTIQDHRDAVLEHEAAQEALREEAGEPIDLCSSDSDSESGRDQRAPEDQNMRLDLPLGQRGEREISVLSDARGHSCDPLGQVREEAEANAIAEEAAIDGYFTKELRRISEVDREARKKTRGPGCLVPEVDTPLTQRIIDASRDATQNLTLSYDIQVPSSDPDLRASGLGWRAGSQETGGYADGRATRAVVEEEDIEMNEAIDSFVGPFAARIAAEEYDIRQGPTWEAALAEEAREAAQKVKAIMEANACDPTLQTNDYLPLSEVMRRLEECGEQGKGKRKAHGSDKEEESEEGRTIGRAIAKVRSTEKGKKRIIETMVTGMLSSKYATQQGMDEARKARLARDAEIKAQNAALEAERQQGERERAEQEGEAEVGGQDREAAGQGAEEGEEVDMSDALTPEPSVPEGMKAWTDWMRNEVWEAWDHVVGTEKAIRALHKRVKELEEANKTITSYTLKLEDRITRLREERGTTERKAPPGKPNDPKNKGKGKATYSQAASSGTNLTPVAVPLGKVRPANLTTPPPPANNHAPTTARKTQAETSAAAASHARAEQREAEREEVAARRITVQLKEDVCAMDVLRNCSITEIGNILGVTPERIAECRVTAKGAIEVTCKTAEESKALIPIISEAEKVKKVEQKEAWTGMVINGVPVHWGIEGMDKLGAQLAEENHITLTTAPRWLVHPSKQMKGAAFQPIVIFVAKTSDRIRASTKGITLEGKPKNSRLYEQTRDRRTKQCNKCCGYGHQWFQCKSQAKCGICSGDHTAYAHRCKVKTCVGAKLRGKCEHTEKVYKCAACGGDHSAFALNCPTRQAAFRRPTDKVATQ